MPVDRTGDLDRGTCSEQRTADGGQGRVTTSEGPDGNMCDGVAAQCLDTQPDRSMVRDGGQGRVTTSEGPDGSVCHGVTRSCTGTQAERGGGRGPVCAGRNSSCVDQGVDRERTGVSTSGVSSTDSDCDEHGSNTAENDSGGHGDMSHSDRCRDTQGIDTAENDGNSNASSCADSGGDTADSRHGSDASMKGEHSSGATNKGGSSPDFGAEGDEQRPLLGPILRQRTQQHRRHRRQHANPVIPPPRCRPSQEQRGEQNANPVPLPPTARQSLPPPPTARQSLHLPPSVLDRWRAVGRQWGVPDDDDDAIARILMRNYEDVRAGRPPRPPPPRCGECGEGLVRVPCVACGPDRYSVRLSHHHDDSTQHHSQGSWGGGGKGGGGCGRC